MGAVFRFLMPTLGGLLFGWAALRSAGLALPLGLHLGGNWIQSSVTGFAPTTLAPDAPVQALWQIPITVHDVRVLTAPDLVPHLPFMLAIAVATLGLAFPRATSRRKRVVKRSCTFHAMSQTTLGTASWRYACTRPIRGVPW